MEPEIIFEDATLAIVNKPAGMVVNKAETVKNLTMQEWWQQRTGITAEAGGEFGEKGGIVHRLDKDTSGIMVLAKTAFAYEHLKGQFLERRTKKEYLALIHGLLRDDHGEVVQPVIRHPKNRQQFTVGDVPARMAITEWKKQEEFNEPGKPEQKLTLVKLIPHTGRTHQLRVHMQYLHHPLVSDPWYGFKKTWADDLTWCPRLFLHAYKLEINHPDTGAGIEYVAPLSGDLQQVLDQLRSQ